MDSHSHSTYQVALEAGYMALVEVISLTGNIFMLLAVYRNRTLLTVPNVFVLALSALDLSLAVFGIPLNFIAIIHGRWCFGDFLCQAIGCFIYFWASASIGTLSLTSLNRYYRVVKPAKYRARFSIRKAIVMIASVWITVLVTLLIITFSVPMEYKYGQSHFCTGTFPTKTKSIAFGLTLHVVFVVGPMIVILMCYYRVFRCIRQHNIAVAPSLNPTNRRQVVSVDEIRITKLLFIIVVGFFMCWTPAVVVGALHYGTDVALPKAAHLIYGHACILSSVINPLLYGGMQKGFRNEFKEILSALNKCS